MKSILIVSELFCVGGLETHIKGEVESLRRLGCDVHLAFGECRSRLLLPSSCQSVTEGLAMHPDVTISEMMQTVGALRQIIRDRQVDLVHAHPFIGLVPAFLAAELEGVPFVATLHGPSALGSYYGPVYDFLLRSVIFPGASAVIAVSPEVARLASLFTDRCTVLPNGVEVGLSREIGEPEPEDKRWIAISRLDSMKVEGLLDFLVKGAAAGLPGVAVVGEGEQSDELMSRLASEGLSDFVEFLGARSDVALLMQRFAGVAGMGRVALEGIANCRPVALVGYDGLKGLVDEALFTKAAFANFSGRDLPTIDAEGFHGQVGAVEKLNREALLDTLKVHYTETVVWSEFLQIASEAVASPVTILGDTFTALQNSAFNAAESFFQSPAIIEWLGLMLASEKHYTARLASAFNSCRARLSDVDRARAVGVVIDHTQAQVHAYQAGLDRLSAELARFRAGEAERWQHLIAQNEALALSLAEARQEVAVQAAERVESQSEVERLLGELAMRDSARLELESCLNRERDEVRKIFASRSWLLTSPLRRLAAYGRKIWKACGRDAKSTPELNNHSANP